MGIHTEPTSKKISQIVDSDLFLYLGAVMEGVAESAAGALSNQKVKLIEIRRNDMVPTW